MKVFRISSPARIRDMSGTGAKLYGGRWNSPGLPILYCASSLSLAMLEVLVHSKRQQLKSAFAFAEITIPEKAQMISITAQELPEDWNHYPASDSLKQMGNQWLRSLETLALRVPSAVNPFEENVLLNPLHPQFEQCEITRGESLHFDLRFTTYVQPG